MQVAVVWYMPIKAMHNSSLIYSESEEFNATVSYMVVAETTQKFLCDCSTTLKWEVFRILNKSKISVCFRAFYRLVAIIAKTFNN